MAPTNEGEHRAETDRGSGSSIDRLLAGYSRWRRVRLEKIMGMPIKQLAVRTAYASACVVADGVLLPWIVVALNRSSLSLALFAFAVVAAIAMEAYVYGKVFSSRNLKRHRQEFRGAEE